MHWQKENYLEAGSTNNYSKIDYENNFYAGDEIPYPEITVTIYSEWEISIEFHGDSSP